MIKLTVVQVFGLIRKMVGYNTRQIKSNGGEHESMAKKVLACHKNLSLFKKERKTYE